MALFFRAVRKQARDRDSGAVRDLDSYIVDRRDDSGVKPCFNLLEYTLGIELPDFVLADPVVQTLERTATDFIAWSNVRPAPPPSAAAPHAECRAVQDVFSYNKEQARGHTYNLVAILTVSRGLDLQGAVDHIGQMCRRAVDAFCEHRARVPSWGPAIDGDVARYVRGLEDWIAGSLHWTFLSERYFGTQGVDIKETLQVTLASRRVGVNAA